MIDKANGMINVVSINFIPSIAVPIKVPPDSLPLLVHLRQQEAQGRKYGKVKYKKVGQYCVYTQLVAKRHQC